MFLRTTLFFSLALVGLALCLVGDVRGGVMLHEQKFHNDKEKLVGRGVIVPNGVENSMIDFTNSSFKASVYVMGDFSSSCRDRNWNRTFAVFETPYQNLENSMRISMVHHSTGLEQFIITDCMNVRDNYHFCAVTYYNGTSFDDSTPYCIKLEQDDNKIKIGLNMNYYDCLVGEDFDIEPECDIHQGNIIFVYESPGENSIFHRNVVGAALLIVLVGCCCCLFACVFGTYCLLIRRRKNNLLRGGINSHEMSEDEAKTLNRW